MLLSLSKYIKGITDRLIKIGNTYDFKHTKTEMYIPHDNIRGVEVINYQTFYAVSIIENGNEIILPKLYEKVELRFLEKIVAEP